MTIEIASLANDPNLSYLTDYLLGLKHLAQPDISNYAKGRLRFWLNYEPELTTKPKLNNAYRDDYITRLLAAYHCDTGLISYHSQQCSAYIKHHRDATYASNRAILFNLNGDATFSYSHDRRNNNPVYCTDYHLKHGDLIEFDCKHLHAMTHATPGRIALVMWQVKQQFK